MADPPGELLSYPDLLFFGFRVAPETWHEVDKLVGLRPELGGLVEHALDGRALLSHTIGSPSESFGTRRLVSTGVVVVDSVSSVIVDETEGE